MKNIFCEKSFTKCGGETGSIPFYKKSKLSKSLDQQPKTSYSLLYCMYPSQWLPKYIGNKMLATCFYLLQRIFEKQEEELVSLPNFLHNFSRRILIPLYFINWPTFIACLPLLLEILNNVCIAIIRCTVWASYIFSLTSVFLHSRFST